MRIFNDFDLSAYNSYHLKAVCKTAYFPENDQDIAELFSDKLNQKILLGNGNNVILSKDYYDDNFVIFSGNYDKIELIGDDQLVCEAGVDMISLNEFAFANGLSGVEIFFDIPSSLGGAVVMNAGASGEDIKGLLIKVIYFDPHTASFKEISKDEIGFEYRNSFFQKNPEMVVCRVFLQLTKGDKAAIRDKMDTIKAARWAKQPREYPNGGSVFKRPPGYYVGAMMDELQLKGFGIGGAKISEKHGGFIVNFNNATGEDILQLIKIIKEKVYQKYSVDIEVEQRVI